MTRRLLICVVLIAAAGAASSCQPSQSADSRNQASSAASTPAAGDAIWQGPPRDLSQDESAGGHVLRKHVGRSDEELRDRLQHEHNISAASTYTDRATAEHAVGSAIAVSQDRIQRWLNRSGGRPNLVLDYDGSQTLGRTLGRGDSHSRPCSHSVIVLKYVLKNAASDYYVLTSYPECRS